MSINTPRLLDQVRAVLRRKQYALRTEEAYVSWFKRYVLFHFFWNGSPIFRFTLTNVRF